MRVADRWTEYRVQDASAGRRLELWNGYTLVRPDPQVIWTTGETHPGWKKPNAVYHRSSQGGGHWDFFDLPEEWMLHYALPGTSPVSGSQQLSFHLKPFAFKHTGVFPEQAANWDVSFRLLKDAAEHRQEAPKVLNLFAYTGGATLAAAAAGAAVTHVDASKGMVSWAKENAESSGLGAAPIRWLVDDCMKFVEREIRRGRKYDAIIMDPPSYGRGPKGEIWKIEESIFPFVQRCAELLSDEPLFFLINSYTTGLQPGVLAYLLQLSVETRHQGSVQADELGLPADGGRHVLPCGASGWWFSAAAAKKL